MRQTTGQRFKPHTIKKYVLSALLPTEQVLIKAVSHRRPPRSCEVEILCFFSTHLGDIQCRGMTAVSLQFSVASKMSIPINQTAVALICNYKIGTLTTAARREDVRQRAWIEV